MDINLGKLSAYVRLDFSKLPSDQAKAKKSIKDFSTKLTREVGESFTSLGQKMSLGITAPLIALGKGAVDAATKMDSLKRGLTAVSGSSAEAEKQLKRLREVAKLPGLSFEQAVEGSTRLQAAGFSAQLAERSLKAFGNALATVGKGAAELEGVNLALSQIQAKGKVSAEEINQIAERVPQIRKIMQNVFGTADTEVLQKAKITSQQFIQAIVGELERLPKVTGGVANSFENFSDAMREALGEVGKAILPDLMRAMKEIEEAVKRFIGWWTKLPEGTRQNIIHFAEFAALIGPLVLAIGSLAGAVSSLTTAFATLKTVTAFLRTPGGLIGAGIVGAGMVIGKVVNDLNNSIAQGNKGVFERDAAEKKANPKGYWQNQINSARIRMQGQTDPAIIAANQRMIARAQAEMKGATKRGMYGPPAPTAEQTAQSALQAQLRAQIAAGQSAANAAKAQAARNKAAAEAARRKAAAEAARRKAVGHATAEYNLFAGNEAADKAAMDARIADWTKQAMESEEKRKKNVWMDFFAKLRGMGERLRTEAGERQQALNAKSATGAAVGKAFDALSQAFGRMGPLMQKAEETRTKQTEQATKERLALEDRYQQHLTRMGQKSLSQYESYLQERLTAVRGNVEEEIRIESELQQVKFGMLEEQERRRYRGWQNLARGLEGVFANAFNDVLSGSKDFFQSLLDGFKQMIAQMLAQALAAGLMRSLFGGGNFLTGFTSVFGFDSGANDSRAHRWGRDFSHHFVDGALEHSRSRAMQGQAGMAAAGGGPVNVTIHFGPVSVASGMDVQAIGEQIGQATRNALRRRV